MDGTENTTCNNRIIGWRRYSRGRHRKYNSSVACAIFATLMSCLLCSNLVTSFSQLCHNILRGWSFTLESIQMFPTNLRVGRTIAQAVSRRLPTAAARVRAQLKSYGICGGQSGTEAGFLQVLWFPLPMFIPSTAPLSSSIFRCSYNRPVSGRRTKWTQSHSTTRKN
jgi:hypothetical protein